MWVCWLSKRVFQVSSGSVLWYRNNSGTAFDIFKIASPVCGSCAVYLEVVGHLYIDLKVSVQRLRVQFSP